MEAGSRNCCTETEQETEEGLWSSLPLDVGLIISSYLYTADRVVFHSICKSWQSISTDRIPLPILTFDHLVKHRPSSPLLMFQESGSRCNFFDPVRNQIYGSNISRLMGASVLFSDHGWLLLSLPHKKMLFFFNPFTRQKIKLRWPEGKTFLTMFFSSPPTSSDCLVVGCNEDVVGVLRMGGNQWKYLTIHRRRKFNPSNSAPVLYKGKYYWLGKDASVRVFDINASLEEPSDICTSTVHGIGTQVSSELLLKEPVKGYMVKDPEHDELLAVFIPPNKTKINILKWDDLKKQWKKTGGLRNKALFISRSCAFLEKPAARGMGNKIFMPLFHGYNGMFYSFSSGKYHSFYDTFSSVSPYQLEEQQCSTWIQPDWNKFNGRDE